MGPFSGPPIFALFGLQNTDHRDIKCTSVLHRTNPVFHLTIYILCIYPVILDKCFFVFLVFSYLFTSFQRSFLASLSAARWHYCLLDLMLFRSFYRVELHTFNMQLTHVDHSFELVKNLYMLCLMVIRFFRITT